MPKTRSGYVYERAGRWYARVTFTDDSGRRRNVKRRAENKTNAKELLRQLLHKVEAEGPRAIDGERMTFAELADHYQETFLVPPQYVDGRKVAGLRTHYDMRRMLRTLREAFAKRRLRTLTHGDLMRYRRERLATPTRSGTQRAIASVNREMALLRRMLNVAMREGWILRNPFNAGESLISLADERKRERILTREEEACLLAECVGVRAHLRPIIISAIDTGMRQGEILKLRWSDVDFESGIIVVRAFNTKTMQERQIAMSERLSKELARLWIPEASEPEDLIFGIADNVKNSFTWVRKATGLEDVRFHDLRHTHATRLVGAHIPLSEVGRVLGHTQANTTYRYVNANVETAKRAAAAIDQFNAAGSDSQ